MSLAFPVIHLVSHQGADYSPPKFLSSIVRNSFRIMSSSAPGGVSAGASTAYPTLLRGDSKSREKFIARPVWGATKFTPKKPSSHLDRVSPPRRPSPSGNKPPPDEPPIKTGRSSSLRRGLSRSGSRRELPQGYFRRRVEGSSLVQGPSRRTTPKKGGATVREMIHSLSTLVVGGAGATPVVGGERKRCASTGGKRVSFSERVDVTNRTPDSCKAGNDGRSCVGHRF